LSAPAAPPSRACAGLPVEIVSEVASTNGELLARIARGEGVNEVWWLVADRQTAGRGRAGRGWIDGAGNYMGSTVVRLRPGDPPPQTLALVAGLAVHEAVTGLLKNSKPILKWPNDLLVDGAKLGGVLLERQGQSVVVGVGINISAAPVVADRSTTCLAALGCGTRRDALAGRLAAAWQARLDQWHRGEWPSLRSEWLARAHPLGTSLNCGFGDERYEGVFAGLDEDGAVHLRLADGTSRVIHAGDVELVGAGR
jgi:BirA family transcriptional regulator, biotin operon repressor / biotin---[acetyl-CoA-carboxylase] ligase